MKLKHIFLIILTFCLFFLNSYSQSVAKNRSFIGFEKNLKESNFDQNTKTKILKLIEERDKNIAEIKIQLEQLNENYPIIFQDPNFTIKHQNQLLIKSLSNILTIEQFKKLFLPQLKSQIERMTNLKVLNFTAKYPLTTEQLSKVKNLCYQNTVNEIITKEYYNYDDVISGDNYEEEKIRSAKKELELFQSFGLLYSNNSKTDAFIKKLREINIAPKQIDLILAALQKRSERMAKHDKVWRANDSTCVIDFYDEGDTQFKFDMELREEVSKVLKIEDFRIIFGPALKERIARESQKEFKTTKAAYNLTEEQSNGLYNLVTEKNTEKVITEEYYKFSYYLYQQKLRAVEYRHEKIIREAIQKMILPSQIK